MCGYQVPENLACYLKKHKVIVFKGYAKGGRVNDVPSYSGPAADVSCDADFSDVFSLPFVSTNQFFLTIRYNDNEITGKNGNIYFQLDELNSRVIGNIYRSIGAGFASEKKITMNEADDATGILEISPNGCITFTRNRDDKDNERRFTFNASNVKVSSICERNKVLGCKK